mmetsp:Transcript_22402/g.64323  ORF Transcript_22402/g.64323 Transcript_22402/m.64323 type:complete len:224 (-) Transcript_22402:485-1156(-)
MLRQDFPHPWARRLVVRQHGEDQQAKARVVTAPRSRAVHQATSAQVAGVLLLIVARKWKGAGAHGEACDPQAEDVRALVVPIAEKDFRGDICLRATFPVQDLAGRDVPHEPEVGQLQRSVKAAALQKIVFQLDVPMYEAAVMEKDQPLEHFPHEPDRHLRPQSALEAAVGLGGFGDIPHDEALQIPACAHVHRCALYTAPPPRSTVLDDVGVIPTGLPPELGE